MSDRATREQAITKQIRLIFKAVQQYTKRVEKASGLSSAKFLMLYEISLAPGIRVSQLARTLSIHPSTCSNMLDKIEQLQLIYRDRSHTDQRSVHLYVAEKGVELLAMVPSPPQGPLSSALQKLSSEQLKNLESSLQPLLEAINYRDEEFVFQPPDG